MRKDTRKFLICAVAVLAIGWFLFSKRERYDQCIPDPQWKVKCPTDWGCCMAQAQKPKKGLNWLFNRKEKGHRVEYCESAFGRNDPKCKKEKCIPMDNWQENCPGDWGCCRAQKRGDMVEITGKVGDSIRLDGF